MNSREEAKKDPYRVILMRLQEKYPEIGLSFGYIGNIRHNHQKEDIARLQWSYFTKIWDHRPHRIYDNCHSFLIGVTETKENRMPEDLENQLEQWIQNTVLQDIGKPCTRR
jgi:hypothetical protein